MKRAASTGGTLGILAAAFMLAAGVSSAQEGAIPPHWIWRDTGKSLGETPGETCYLRKSFDVKEPSRLTIDVTADNTYTLYLDGKEVASGSDWNSSTRVLLAIRPGPHVLAAKVSNEAPGAAGFVLAGGVLPLGQGIPIHSNASWRGTATAPTGLDWTKPGFDDSRWPHARDWGALGMAPWGAIALGKDAAERFKSGTGLKVETAADPAVTGSVVAFTFDPQGAPCVSIERGPIARLRDDDGDGRYDRREVIEDAVKNCQGLVFIGDALWVIGQGPHETGLHRLHDRDKNGLYETVELVRGTIGGMGEHGPHAVNLGPDGLLYVNNGNHAHWKPPIASNSPVNIAYEGELLGHYNDPRGHAAGIMAPGGEIMQSPDGGKTWERVAAGFRNEYDFAFHADGSLFSFDSDMEWDVGVPWYRPVRVVFCPTGVEFGWRNGSGKWPTYYADSLPAVLDVGRGSPTGVTFYQANRLPAAYHDNFLICDWSQGRILAIKLERQGGSYRATASDLVTGQPLNCTDIETGPDQAVYFTTGGRGTQGGLYRVVPAADSAVATPPATARGALALGSPLASFTQKKYAEIKAADASWAATLEAVARNASGQESAADRLRALLILSTAGPKPADALLFGLASDTDAAVRGRAIGLLGLRPGPETAMALVKALADRDPFVRRLACEGMMRQRADAILIPALGPLLVDPDRFVRSAARTAIEHGKVSDWKSLLLAFPPSHALVEGMIAIARATRLDADAQADLLKRQEALIPAISDDALLADLLRAMELTWILGPKKPADVDTTSLRKLLLGKFNRAADTPANRELARLLAYLNEPDAVAAIVEHQRTVADHAAQIHDSYCLRALKSGWTSDSKKALWAWYQTASAWEGGFSFQGYLDGMLQELVAVMTPEERAWALAAGERAPFPTRILVRGLDLGSDPRLATMLEALDQRLGSSAMERDLSTVIIEKLGQVDTPETRSALKRVFERDPARRDSIARALMRRPREEDLPILALVLESNDENMVRSALRALERLHGKPAGPEPLAALLRSARRLGPGMSDALNLLASRWTGQAAPRAKSGGFNALLAAWEKVYHERYPNGPTLDRARPAEHNYTLAELSHAIVDSGLIKKASPARGREVIKRAKCLDCHKFGNDGQGVGPDLTTVNSRFRPAEILESILEPSKVISDQYKPLTVATVDGKTFNGMPIATDPRNLVLLLSDGTKATIPVADIEARKESTVSVMPQGLLKTLTVAEVADLLALFESAPRVATPGAKTP